MNNNDKFKGIIAPIVSPCDDNDMLDMKKLELNFNRLLNTGIHGLYICGGTGDGENLSAVERKQIAEYLIPRLKEAGKTSIVHVGQTFQRAAVELAEHAASIGADAIASIPPRASWNEVISYYTALASVGLPVFVYYIPGVTGMTASLGDLNQLLGIKGVEGIKMSDWNIFLLRQVKLAHPDKIVYSGYDEMLLPGLLYGADGSIGTWANILPDMYVKVYQLVRAGEYEKAAEIQGKFTEFLAIGWNYGIIDAFEELMLTLGYANRCFRHPSSWNPGKVDKNGMTDMIALMGEINKLVVSL